MLHIHRCGHKTSYLQSKKVKRKYACGSIIHLYHVRANIAFYFLQAINQYNDFQQTYYRVTEASYDITCFKYKCSIFIVPFTEDAEVLEEVLMKNRKIVCEGCLGGRILIGKGYGGNRTVNCMKMGLDKNEEEPTDFSCKYVCNNNDGTTSNTTTPMNLTGKCQHLSSFIHSDP